MLRLLFCALIGLPFAILPWIANGAGTLPSQMNVGTFDELVLQTSLKELEACEVADLPIFYREGLITMHSADLIAESLRTADDCGPVNATVIGILPEEADREDWNRSRNHADELIAHVETVANITDAKVQVRLADQILREDISTLYINGRAAILRLEPQSLTG